MKGVAEFLKCVSWAQIMLHTSFRAGCQREALLAGWLRPLVFMDDILIPIVSFVYAVW